jgi:hypothetical protein
MHRRLDLFLMTGIRRFTALLCFPYVNAECACPLQILFLSLKFRMQAGRILESNAKR